MKNIYTLLILFVSFICCSQTTTYTTNNNDVLNPERGFYHHSETHSNNYSSLNLNTLNSYSSQNISLILRVFYLEDFISGVPISQDYLDKMESDFEKIRYAGLKVIIRFAYTDDGDAAITDPNMGGIQTHIMQLNPILDKNKDIIYCIQAGFIGHWGEWYKSTNFGIGDNLNAFQIQNRKELLNYITAFFPHGVQIQIRTPYYKKQIFNTTVPVNESIAYGGVTDQSRIGHHNDCFLANSNDYGTFNNQSDRDYLEAESQYTVVGGETCNLNTQYSNCSNALDKLNDYSFDYLNIDYNQQVLNSWQNNCFDEIKRRLGYRFELSSTTINLNNNTISINFNNVGFGHLVNEKIVYVMYKNTNTGLYTSVLINTDPRFWLKNQNLNITSTIPALEVGQYDIYLSVSDKYLDDNRYNIAFANPNVFEVQTGLNNLNSRFEITLLHNNTFNQNINLNDYNVKVFDISGRYINNNMNSLSTGIYIVKYTLDNKVLTKKIFIK